MLHDVSPSSNRRVVHYRALSPEGDAECIRERPGTPKKRTTLAERSLSRLPGR